MRRHAEHTEAILAPHRRLRRAARRSPPRTTSGSTAAAIRAACAPTQISLETRIITVADIFDAITADRPYRAAVPVPQTLETMAGMVGTAVDPLCFEALRQVIAGD